MRKPARRDTANRARELVRQMEWFGQPDETLLADYCAALSELDAFQKLRVNTTLYRLILTERVRIDDPDQDARSLPDAWPWTHTYDIETLTSKVSVHAGAAAIRERDDLAVFQAALHGKTFDEGAWRPELVDRWQLTGSDAVCLLIPHLPEHLAELVARHDAPDIVDAMCVRAPASATEVALYLAESGLAGGRAAHGLHISAWEAADGLCVNHHRGEINETVRRAIVAPAAVQRVIDELWDSFDGPISALITAAELIVDQRTTDAHP